MAAKFDLVVRGGTIVDGTGRAPFAGDVGISGQHIAAVGPNLAAGADEIDARGLLVTPGFVDVHTHYDGQVTWSSQLSPSSYHGVTTAIMGNCGVGFAPCRKDDHERLIGLMEGVEDIPEIVMTEGIPWNWETFPEYLDAVAARSYDMDVAAQLPHSALRVYVMGQRGADRERATVADETQMTELARAAMEAGAVGFSTSRTRNHKTGQGAPIPSLGAAESELFAIAEGMRQAGSGVLEIASDFDDVAQEFDALRRIASASGRPMTIPIAQTPDAPDKWKQVLDQIARARGDGLPMMAQITARPVGMLMGHALSCNPFSFCATYRALERLPLEQRVAALRRPEIRARLLSEEVGAAPLPALERVRSRLRRFESMFVLGKKPDYAPPADETLAARARHLGVKPEEIAYDAMLADDGSGLLYLPIVNYVDNSLDNLCHMLKDESSIVALGDGGAHYGSICDASYSTYLLTYWTKERAGEKLDLTAAVKALTATPARAIGLRDRGVIAEGLKADLNVIDYDRLRLHQPEISYGLPGNGRYLIQKADGYVATIVSGRATYMDGVATGALPGRLVRMSREGKMRPSGPV